MSKEYNILIIGCGNVGFRHFQSILKFQRVINFYLYDKDIRVYSKFKKYLNEHNIHKNVVFLNSLTTKLNLFCCLIATTLNNRFDLIKRITNNSKIKFLIIEKIPFFNVMDFKKCIIYLKEKKIKAWVNCPNRAYVSYKNLKKNIKSNNVNIIINGGNWGILSNSIHYIDLFNYFNEYWKPNKIEINNFKVVPSKRKNFQDAKGSLSIKYKNNYLILNDLYNYDLPVTLDISNQYEQYFVFEGHSYFFYINKKNLKTKSGKFNFELQSNLTHKYLNSLATKSSCDLISLENCYNYFAPFILKINKKLKDLNFKKINIT